MRIVYIEPFGHGANFLAYVLCVEPFGHGTEYMYCVLSHLGMEVIS